MSNNNNPTEPNKGGRPPLYDNPEKLQEQIDKYWEYIKKEHAPPTITGLALYLGFESRYSFYDYEKREGFTHTIKRARTQIECVYEAALMRERGNPAGPIFALKNLGWRDEQSVLITDDRITVAALFPTILEEIENVERPGESEQISKP